MNDTTTALPGLKAPLVLVALGGLFGAAFLFMKVLAEELAPIEIVAGRLALASAVILGIIAVRGRIVRITPARVGSASMLALLDSVIPFTLIAWAETRIDSGVASVLVSTMPLFTVIIATTASPAERLPPVRLVGIPLGLLGVITLTGGDVLNITGGNAMGQLAVVAAAACYGAAAVYAKVLLKTEDAFSLTGTKLAAGAAMAATLVAITRGTPSYANLSIEGALALAALGLLSTALAFTLYFWLVDTAGSVYASLVTYVVPVFGLLLGWAILGEEAGIGTAFGALLIGAGVTAVMYGSVLQASLARRVRRPWRPATTAHRNGIRTGGPGMTGELRLMLILAHPDDESLGNGGIIAKYAAEGVKTYLLTATRGEQGWFGPQHENPGPEALGRVREAELREAARVLGIAEVSFLDYRDGEFDRADAGEVVTRIVGHIRRVKPHVVVTFDQNGLYGHPDHIAICRHATTAVAAAADPGFPDLGNQSSHHVAKLYYMALTPDKMKLYESAFGELTMQINGQPRRSVPWQEWAITTRIDAVAHWRQAWAAISRHRSQLPGYGELLALPEAVHQRLWGDFAYYRVFSRVSVAEDKEGDLFEGLRRPECAAPNRSPDLVLHAS